MHKRYSSHGTPGRWHFPHSVCDVDWCGRKVEYRLNPGWTFIIHSLVAMHARLRLPRINLRFSLLSSPCSLPLYHIHSTHSKCFNFKMKNEIQTTCLTPMPVKSFWNIKNHSYEYWIPRFSSDKPKLSKIFLVRKLILINKTISEEFYLLGYNAV
jgi:hypothetical protein